MSRQAQEVDLLQGRIDGPKVHALIAALLPVGCMDEVFICGPDGMISATEAALLEAGVPPQRIRTERFSTGQPAAIRPAASPTPGEGATDAARSVALAVVLDGKTHELRMAPHEHVLDVALQAGLDLPYSCKAGVCCTCRAKVLEGSATMDKNFTLEAPEMAQGFVLSCQCRPTGGRLLVSFDER